ncbi:MAG: SpoIIE family protein phosphatase [Sphingobacteriaceae bacterium]|nr:SpoIIE family protein phosphatase [Sphingobacteriaceae bacterium]
MNDTIIQESEVVHEFNRSTDKAHVIACWVGIILNLAWFASDYFVLPDHWFQFLLFRVVVSSVSFILLIFRKKFNISIYFCAFTLVLGISVQNSYMWSVMDVSHLQQHAFAYIALFIGVGMLVLWEVIYSLIIVIVSLITNVVFYLAYSPLTVDEFLTHGGFLTLTVAIFCVFLIRTRYRLTYKEIRSRMELANSKKIIEKEHKIVVEQKKEILDSINYAKRIQNAMLASDSLFQKNLNDYFILFQPKDIVSGDFYWATAVKSKQNGTEQDLFILATADSTGHGVPGAMMSMLNIACLNEAVNERKLYSPAAILNHARDKIITSLADDGSVDGGKDGMDCSIVVFNLKDKKIKVAGANNPVWITRELKEGIELFEIKPDKMPVGKHETGNKSFSESEFEILPGDVVYTLTDGFPDQFGGNRQKKYTSKRLREELRNMHKSSIHTKKEVLMKNFSNWKGDVEQIDDVLLIGVAIS